MHGQTGHIFFKLLINKFAPKKAEALVRLLPPEEAEAVHAYTFTNKEPDTILFRPTVWVQSIHPSWLQTPISEIPEPLRSCINHLFPKKDQEVTEYPYLVKSFLLSLLHTHWKEQEPIPKALIPQTPLEPLLYCKTQELITVADLLAIYDIVEEVRQIVDKKILHALVQLLTPTQQQYLRLILRHKVKGGGFQVTNLIKEPKKLRLVLHKRGLEKLGAAISGLDLDFLLHIYHSFDVKRAQYLMTVVKQEEVAEETNATRLQLLQIFQFLAQKTTSE